MSTTMSTHSAQLVAKLWRYCDLLRDDGLSYGDYVEQLTYLLFLKMAHERTQPPRNEPSRLPAGYDWPSLLDRDGAELEAHYNELLRELGKQPGLLGLIFRKAQNRVQDPSKLKRLVADLIDQETWTGIDADVKGDVYEGLLEKNAADTKSGAGQYFTPRALIKAMVDVMQPKPGMTIADPACGTGGFLLAAHDYIADHHALDRDQKKFLRDRAFHGVEIVDNTARLCAMNLFLHGIGGASVDAEPSIAVKDSLAAEPSVHYDMVLANPPFGKKSSVTLVGEDGRATNSDLTVSRPDFWATTSNKQLNFLQHIRSMLRVGGAAAVVLPDNVLFEGGAGGNHPPPLAARVRRAHAPAPADRALLRPGGEGQHRLLRAPAWCHDRDPGDERAVGLRLPHEPALHTEDQAADAARPRRLRRQVPARPPARTDRGGELQALELRRDRTARWLQPRHLGRRQGRIARGRGQPARSRSDRRGDRRQPDDCARAVRRGRRRAERRQRPRRAGLAAPRLISPASSQPGTRLERSGFISRPGGPGGAVTLGASPNFR